jgi:hypothetical protein
VGLLDAQQRTKADDPVLQPPTLPGPQRGARNLEGCRIEVVGFDAVVNLAIAPGTNATGFPVALLGVAQEYQVVAAPEKVPGGSGSAGPVVAPPSQGER